MVYERQAPTLMSSIALYQGLIDSVVDRVQKVEYLHARFK